MNHQKLIIKRCSRRSYLKKPLSLKMCSAIEKIIVEINSLSQLNCQFVKDGSKPFSSILKTYGLFSNVQSFIKMQGHNDTTNLFEKVGYYGEELILRLTKLNLGTCWVGGTYDPKHVQVIKDHQLVCLITVGYVDDLQTNKEKMIKDIIAKKRKSIEQRLISDVIDIPQWLKNGMEMVIHAPSAKNTQKPMFVYKQGVLSANIDETYRFDLIDLGIAKRHFEIGAGGRFEFGNGGIYRRLNLI
jgi:hypothetical protein